MKMVFFKNCVFVLVILAIISTVDGIENINSDIFRRVCVSDRASALSKILFLVDSMNAAPRISLKNYNMIMEKSEGLSLDSVVIVANKLLDYLFRPTDGVFIASDDRPDYAMNSYRYSCMALEGLIPLLGDSANVQQEIIDKTALGLSYALSCMNHKITNSPRRMLLMGLINGFLDKHVVTSVTASGMSKNIKNPLAGRRYFFGLGGSYADIAQIDSELEAFYNLKERLRNII